MTQAESLAFFAHVCYIVTTSPVRVSVPVPLQAVRGNVKEVIEEKDQRGIQDSLLKDLDLEQVRGSCGEARNGRVCMAVPAVP